MYETFHGCAFVHPGGRSEHHEQSQTGEIIECIQQGLPRDKAPRRHAAVDRSLAAREVQTTAGDHSPDLLPCRLA